MQLNYPKTIDHKSIFEMKQTRTLKMSKAQQTQKIISFCSLILLGTWITLRFNYCSYFLKEALICSAIISTVIFLRSADASDWFSNKEIS